MYFSRGHFIKTTLAPDLHSRTVTIHDLSFGLVSYYDPGHSHVIFTFVLHNSIIPTLYIRAVYNGINIDYGRSLYSGHSIIHMNGH